MKRTSKTEKQEYKIQDLPSELHLFIFSFFNIGELLQLALVSRSWHDLINYYIKKHFITIFEKEPATRRTALIKLQANKFLDDLTPASRRRVLTVFCRSNLSFNLPSLYSTSNTPFSVTVNVRSNQDQQSFEVYTAPIPTAYSAIARQILASRLSLSPEVASAIVHRKKPRDKRQDVEFEQLIISEQILRRCCPLALMKLAIHFTMGSFYRYECIFNFVSSRLSQFTKYEPRYYRDAQWKLTVKLERKDHATIMAMPIPWQTIFGISSETLSNIIKLHIKKHSITPKYEIFDEIFYTHYMDIDLNKLELEVIGHLVSNAFPQQIAITLNKSISETTNQRLYHNFLLLKASEKFIIAITALIRMDSMRNQTLTKEVNKVLAGCKNIYNKVITILSLKKTISRKFSGMFKNSNQNAIFQLVNDVYNILSKTDPSLYTSIDQATAKINSFITELHQNKQRELEEDLIEMGDFHDISPSVQNMPNMSARISIDDVESESDGNLLQKRFK